MIDAAEYRRLLDKKFMAAAKFASTLSEDQSTKTGAVIVIDKWHLVATGYNRFPAAMSNDQALWNNREEKYSRVVHAEVAAIVDARCSVIGCTLYLWPYIPCDRCCVMCIHAGISRIVAPRATPEQLLRWGAEFEKTRRYCQEAGVQLEEIDATL